MNDSTVTARTVVDELVRGGIRDAVLAPGSRSAPLALALHDAEAAGRVRLHVRIDERSAGFLALGLAKVTGRPVPVVTTSGTAVANLHPAVLEASHAGVPLVVVTADRPAQLRGTGANQTTDQVKIFGAAVRLFADSERADRALVARAVAAASGRGGAPGPVHLNLQLDEPLVPENSTDPEVWPSGRDGGAPWTEVAPMPSAAPVMLEAGPSTVVVAGDSAGPPARMLAERGGWTLLAEPSSGSRTGSHALGPYRLLLDFPALTGRIERVIVYGHPTLSRQVNRLLSRHDVEVVVVGSTDAWADPGRHASRVVPAATILEPTDDGAWLRQWHDADSRAQAAIAACLDAEPMLTPYEVARVMSQAVPPRGLLVVGSSHPIRDLDLMAVAPAVGGRRKVIANRGLSGIDGMVSTAIGAALGRDSSRSLAYVGDLTFLHDSNGLLIGPHEPRPDLAIVVANDDGGSLFSVLAQGDERFAESFERLFGTPTGADLAALCVAAAIPHTRVDAAGALQEALDRPVQGIEVIEVRLDRADRRGLDSRVSDAVADALAGEHMRSSD